MLPDPLSIEYDASTRDLPRASFKERSRGVRLATSQYLGSTADDNELSIQTTRYAMSNGDEAVEVQLYVLHPPSSTDPFSYGQQLGNGVAITLIRNPYGYETAADIADLRSALDDLLSNEITRLLGGEI